MFGGKKVSQNGPPLLVSGHSQAGPRLSEKMEAETVKSPDKDFFGRRSQFALQTLFQFVGGAIGKASRGVMSLGNKAGVIIELKSSGSKGLALMSGVDGLTIKLRQ